MCDPILVTLLKMRPHYNSQSSHENATPSSGTSSLAYYKEVPPPPGGFSPAFATPELQRHELVYRLVRMSVTNFLPLPSKAGLILAWLLHRSRQGPCHASGARNVRRSPNDSLCGKLLVHLHRFECNKILKSDWLSTALISALRRVFSVSPFKIDQNKKNNRSIDKVHNLGNERR